MTRRSRAFDGFPVVTAWQRWGPVFLVFALVLLAFVSVYLYQTAHYELACRERCEPFLSRIIDTQCHCMDDKRQWLPQAPH